MNKKLPIILLVVVLLLGLLGFVVWQKMQSSPVESKKTPAVSVKQVDMASQPQWVQDLQVTIKKGRSANGLDNFTFKITRMPKDIVQTIGYVAQYDTTNKGSQGALSTTNPLMVNGKEEISKTIDLGTCSTHSCVRHEGVTAVDLELDFTTTNGDQPVWSKNLPF